MHYLATAARLAGATLALVLPCVALAGTASATLTITATVLPSRAQALKTATIVVHEPSGPRQLRGSEELDALLKAPARVLRETPADGKPVRITIDY